MTNKKLKIKIRCRVCDRTIYKHKFKGKLEIKETICSTCYKTLKLIPHNCSKCSRNLYYCKNNKNFVYLKGEYVCKDCLKWGLKK